MGNSLLIVWKLLFLLSMTGRALQGFRMVPGRHVRTMQLSPHSAIDSMKISMAASDRKERTMVDQLGAASLASAATVAAAAVNAAVSMRPLSAPDASKSFVLKDGASEHRIGVVDEAGLPLVYDKQLIETYWKKQVKYVVYRGIMCL